VPEIGQGHGQGTWENGGFRAKCLRPVTM